MKTFLKKFFLRNSAPKEMLKDKMVYVINTDRSNVAKK